MDVIVVPDGHSPSQSDLSTYLQSIAYVGKIGAAGRLVIVLVAKADEKAILSKSKNVEQSPHSVVPVTELGDESGIEITKFSEEALNLVTANKRCQICHFSQKREFYRRFCDGQCRGWAVAGQESPHVQEQIIVGIVQSPLVWHVEHSAPVEAIDPHLVILKIES